MTRGQAFRPGSHFHTGDFEREQPTSQRPYDACKMLKPDRKISLLERQRCQVQFGPGGGAGVERAFQIITLVADHLADMHNHLRQGLPGAPMVADANLLRIDIRMENRRGHAAKGGPARIIQRKKHFRLVQRARTKRILSIGHQSIHLKCKGIFFRGRSFGFDEANIRMVRKNPLDQFIISGEPP